VVSEGAVPVADGSGKDVNGAVTYKSNTLKITVDGQRASGVQKAVKKLEKRHDKRTVLQGCSGTQGDATRSALQYSQRLASGAATAAASGSAAKFEEYFRTTASSSRQLVANRFRAIATESGSTTSGGTDYYCTDTLGYCTPNVIAYTLPSNNIIVNCPIYYSELSLISSQCYGQDRASTTLHEFTHAPAVVSPFCEDYAYGYAASTRLPASQALQNADSYALFALGRSSTARGCLKRPSFPF
jgi:deuterolysin